MTSDLSSVRTSANGRRPHDIRVSNRYPRPRTYPRRPFNLCHEGRHEVVQQVVVWFDCFYRDIQGCCGSLYAVYIQKPSVLWRAPFSLKSTREDSIVVVSVMACHLPAWPPVGTNGASLMTSSSTVATSFLAIAHFGSTVACQSVMGLRPCSTSQCWLSIPMWNLNLQLRCIAKQNSGSEGRRSAACVLYVLHPLPLLLSSCLGCIPPLIGLPFLRFYAVASGLFLLIVYFCLCFLYFLSIATMTFAGYFLVRSLLSAFPPYFRTNFRFDLVWFRLSCDHGWTRSGSVNVR